MAKGPEYILSDDVKKVFEKLLVRIASETAFASFQPYANLDINRFAFALSTRAARTYNGVKHVAAIQSIAEPLSLTTPFRYIISVYDGAGDWAMLSDEQKHLALLHQTLRVDLDHEYNHPDWDKQRAGRLLGPDVHDFRKMLEVFGLDWVKMLAPQAPVTTTK